MPSSYSSSDDSESTSPIRSIRLDLASAKPTRTPFPNFELSDPYYWSPSMYSDDSMMGNQLAYFEKHGYPSLPATAGQQYLSPESPSPCVKLTQRRSSQEAQKSSVTSSRKRSRSLENNLNSSSSEHAQTSKRPRVDFLPPQKAKTVGEMQSILDKMLGLEEDVEKLLAENRHATEMLRADICGLLREGESPRSFKLGGEST